MSGWRLIETAPKDGTRILGRRAYIAPWPASTNQRYQTRKTFWGKTSHVPLYGWNYGRDVEDLDLWEPTHWKPLAKAEG